MSFPRFFFALTVTIGMAGAGFAANPVSGPAQTQGPPLLPQQFAGWQRQGSAQISSDAAAAFAKCAETPGNLQAACKENADKAKAHPGS